MSSASSENKALTQAPKRRGLFKSVSEPARSNKFGSPVKVVSLFLLLFLVSQFIAYLLLQIFLNLGDREVSEVTISESAGLQFAYILIAEALVIFFIYKILKRGGLGWSSIGLGRRPERKDLTRALVAFGIYYLVLIVVLTIVSAFIPDLDAGQTQDVGFKGADAWPELLIAFIALVILPPIGEEVAVRGYLYSGLRASWQIGPALVLTSLIFATAHLQTGSGSALLWGAAINTFVLSVVLIYLREKTRALYSGMAVHGLNNLVAFGVYFYGVAFWPTIIN